MRRRRRLIAGLSAALAAGLPAWAGAVAPAAQILTFEIGPRAAGLGGAYSAVADGADSLWWNPAGLARVSQPEAGFVQSRWLEQFGLYGLQMAAPASPNWSFGLGALYADYGTFNLVDNTGSTQFGQYSAGDLVAAGGAARSWEDGRYSVGVAGKVIQERIETESAEGAALDFGGRYHQGAWSASSVVQNVGPSIKFLGQTSPMPTTLRLGGAWEPGSTWAPLAGTMVSLDLVRPYGMGLSARLGAEYRTPAYRGVLAVLRLGYSTLASAFTGLTYGFGVESPRGSFDFAMQPSVTGAATSWIGLSARFGSAIRAPRSSSTPARIEAASPEPPHDRRPPAQVLADVMAWYRHKVADGLLTREEREDVLQRLLIEFKSQGVDLSDVHKELDALPSGAH